MLSYEKAESILTSQGKFHICLGLERVQNFLNLIKNPQQGLRCIHVAGTNGKGSVCAMLSAILSKNGFKTGLFTSPHVFEYTERIKINDIEIDKEIFSEKIFKTIKIAEKNNIHLTEFEILTVVALEYFAQNNVDIVILETGLGGRLDATNVIDSNIFSIITHIDFDHTERLGNTIEKITYEKAGIIKPNCPVIISKRNSGINIIKKIAEQKKSEIIFSKEGRCFQQESCALKGTYQQENLALVFKAVEILNKNGFNLKQEGIENGLKNVKHPCRFEYLKEYNILIDGAHNPNGTKMLRESLKKIFPDQKFKFVFGCLKNKNYAEMMKNLFRPDDEIYFYNFNNPNSCSYNDLARACEFNSKPFDSFKNDNNTLTVICGSFYMIKELLQKMVIK